jgi:uncharacterized membrane protein SpoIIM required for sporulation
LSAVPFALKSAQFRQEREASWQELDRLVTRLEARGAGGLSAEELHRLPALHRGAAGALSVARAISLDRALLDYLNALVGRSHIALYGTRRGAAGEAAGRFFRDELPRTLRRRLPFVLTALLLLLLGIATGFAMTLADPERYASFVGAEMAGGRSPSSSTRELREVLYSTQQGDQLGLFASYLFTHNTQVGFLCFSLGFAFGLPVSYLLFQNGLVLGAMAAIYHQRGLSLEFWAWVLPHGVAELSAVCLCGGAGLLLGHALLFPGRRTRLASLAARGREAAVLVLGATLLFLGAGLIEGIFRQVVQDVAVRWLVAVASLASLIAYVTAAGRELHGARR